MLPEDDTGARPEKAGSQRPRPQVGKHLNTNEPPPPYRPKYLEEARAMSEVGFTLTELARRLGVGLDTINLWKLCYPEFAEALRSNTQARDDRVEAALYQRAVGYEYASEKVLTVSKGGDAGSDVVHEPVVVHVPADVQAASRWLSNRQPGRWGERTAVELSGPDKGPIQVDASVEVDERIARRIIGIAAHLRDNGLAGPDDPGGEAES